MAQCFEQLQVPYLVIGGIAQAVIGEPRMTHDVDCIIAVLHDRLEDVLTGLQHAGFEVDQGAARAQVASTGTFSVTRGRWRVDLIVASTEFEQSAFRRAQRMRLFDVDIPLPTPEDFVLLKLVPGREKDLLDAKIVLIRHRDRLDRVYLEQWAQRLSDEAEDSRIWQTLQRLLKEADERPSG
ncbi:MAG: hypothetical protein HYZ96_02610 [Candidatus Omnitrophica bacterium]|nr:hypothetical protein [Candidatus Omnitrophota bacterium]